MCLLGTLRHLSGMFWAVCYMATSPVRFCTPGAGSALSYTERCRHLTSVQCWGSVADVDPALYRRYVDFRVLCWAGFPGRLEGIKHSGRGNPDGEAGIPLLLLKPQQHRRE